ncbi:hypothetical protein KJ359_010573 [Pestalotiopsis sp. 9143b]|nr:hypothetical protein KJ359_010573 [Pestalotiopsis sp. 9143b]
MSAIRSADRNKTVAVIGAGLSGVVSAAHLLNAGLDVTVFERADSAGGAWQFHEETERDPPYPNTRPTIPDWEELERLRCEGLGAEVAALIFAPPGPTYANMKSRGSEQVMRTSLESWPEGEHAPFDHSVVAAYLQRIARVDKMESQIHFRTRVESVVKNPSDIQWLILTTKFVASSTSYALEKKSWCFDAVVVASGRYGAPRVPDIPGLSCWKHMFPKRVTHAKQYRSPTLFRGKTVIVIGAFISASEITNELISCGAKAYQSGKDTRFDFRISTNNENVEKVSMVAEFIIDTEKKDEVEEDSRAHDLDDDGAIPGRAVLEDGRVLEDIHHVIIATGYMTEYPFLDHHLQQRYTALEDADDTVITTADGRTVHNLHEDIFYIPDPSLAFIGVSHFASTFSLYDFQAQVLAEVFAGRVKLPLAAVMKADQRHRKCRLLPGTNLNSIFLLDDFVIRRLMRWANQDLIPGGWEPLTGPDPAWWAAFKEERENSRPLLKELQDNYLGTYGVTWASLSTG